MIFRCPTCGAIKKYNQWVLPTLKMQREAEDYQGEIAILAVRCPKCKVLNVKRDD